jgi:hypothetical protein
MLHFDMNLKPVPEPAPVTSKARSGSSSHAKRRSLGEPQLNLKARRQLTSGTPSPNASTSRFSMVSIGSALSSTSSGLSASRDISLVYGNLQNPAFWDYETEESASAEMRALLEIAIHYYRICYLTLSMFPERDMKFGVEKYHSGHCWSLVQKTVGRVIEIDNDKLCIFVSVLIVLSLAY